MEHGGELDSEYSGPSRDIISYYDKIFIFFNIKQYPKCFMQ